MTELDGANNTLDEYRGIANAAIKRYVLDLEESK